MTEPSRPPVAVEFDLVPSDWVAACQAHYERSAFQKERLGTIRKLIVVIWALSVLLALLVGSVWTGLFMSVTLAVWLALVPLFDRWIRRRMLERYAEKGVANGMFGPHRVELHPEGIRDSTPAYESLVRWHALEAIHDADDLLLLYTGPESFLPIPRHAFADSRALRDFADELFRLHAAADGRPDRILADF